MDYRNWRAQATYHNKIDSGTLLVGALGEEPSCEGLFTLVKVQQEPLLEIIHELEIMTFLWYSGSYELFSTFSLQAQYDKLTCTSH